MDRKYLETEIEIENLKRVVLKKGQDDKNIEVLIGYYNGFRAAEKFVRRFEIAHKCEHLNISSQLCRQYRLYKKFSEIRLSNPGQEIEFAQLMYLGTFI